MRDIPMFCTELGVASLVLNKIPYTKEAYIHLRDSKDNEAFLKECCDFCKAAGAESVYATGDDWLSHYPHHTTIIRMQCCRELLKGTGAMLFPVQDSTIEKWREIYNENMANVSNASYMTSFAAKKRLASGGLYFVHKCGRLLGIGVIGGNCIEAIAAVEPGTGVDVMLALCSVVTDPIVTLIVSIDNAPAMALYNKLGFVAVEEIEKWYKIL